jgi:hypothetical protein
MEMPALFQAGRSASSPLPFGDPDRFGHICARCAAAANWLVILSTGDEAPQPVA